MLFSLATTTTKSLVRIVSQISKIRGLKERLMMNLKNWKEMKTDFATRKNRQNP